MDALRELPKSTRGVGNFRNLFLHSPNGKKDGVQPIPVSEDVAKDEFTGIKSVTRDDVLASLRIPAAAGSGAAECWRLRVHPRRVRRLRRDRAGRAADPDAARERLGWRRRDAVRSVRPEDTGRDCRMLPLPCLA